GGGGPGGRCGDSAAGDTTTAIARYPAVAAADAAAGDGDSTARIDPAAAAHAHQAGGPGPVARASPHARECAAAAADSGSGQPPGAVEPDDDAAANVARAIAHDEPLGSHPDGTVGVGAGGPDHAALGHTSRRAQPDRDLDGAPAHADAAGGP